ncbi:TPA: hypothetical protein N3G60_002095 [Salmonella enterica subsp. enterica serovar Minnesota]|nr:hypothetical protein [Salmonella enterica subsp. enterica serovar Minnesota]
MPFPCFPTFFGSCVSASGQPKTSRDIPILLRMKIKMKKSIHLCVSVAIAMYTFSAAGKSVSNGVFSVVYTSEGYDNFVDTTLSISDTKILAGNTASGSKRPAFCVQEPNSAFVGCTLEETRQLAKLMRDELSVEPSRFYGHVLSKNIFTAMPKLVPCVIRDCLFAYCSVDSYQEIEAFYVEPVKKNWSSADNGFHRACSGKIPVLGMIDYQRKEQEGKIGEFSFKVFPNGDRAGDYTIETFTVTIDARNKPEVLVKFGAKTALPAQASVTLHTGIKSLSFKLKSQQGYRVIEPGAPFDFPVSNSILFVSYPGTQIGRESTIPVTLTISTK